MIKFETINKYGKYSYNQYLSNYILVEKNQNLMKSTKMYHFHDTNKSDKRVKKYKNHLKKKSNKSIIHSRNNTNSDNNEANSSD